MKKSIFMVLTLLFVLMGTIVFGATFSDVKGTKYQSSVELLTTLKIVNGKTSTSFAPNDEVRRSEMAKMLVIAMGKESEATKSTGKTKFPDVVDNHWATGYINIATGLGLIKGYPDGTFAPDDPVSYVEALTMMLRALGYEDVDKLTWPTGYINRAKDINLVKNVAVSDYDKKAIRGDIAILLDNTLLSNTREIVATNDSGAIYGNGKALISKSFSSYECYDNSIVTDIDDNEGTIVITDANSKKHTFKYAEKDIYSLYGKDVRVVYDTKNKTFLVLEVASSNSTVSGNVTKVESKKIYVKKVAYTLPKSSYIKLIGITDISDANEAYVTTKNGTVTHVLAIGEEDLYIGLTTSKSAKSNNKYRVTVVDTEGESDTLVLADQTLSIKKDQVLIYALNSDDELIVRYQKGVDDGLEVESVSKTELKLKGKTKYTFSTSDKPVIIEVDDGEISEKSSLTSIDEKYDTAVVVEGRSKNFVIYFVGGLDEDDIEDENASSTIKAAKKRIAAAISSANAKKEASYSIATYEKMLVKLEAAETVQDKYASTTKDSSTAINALDKASLALENAINNLEKATSADKTLRADFDKLTAKISEAKKLAKNTEYTEASRTALSKVITTSEKITISTTTSAKIQTAINNLDDAIDALVNTATQEEIAEIKAEIQELLRQAKEKKESDYTKESYAKLKEAVAAAEAITDYTKERISKLTNISNNLTTALKNLVSYDSERFDEAVSEYKAEKAKVDKLNESDYTEKSWEALKEFIIDIDKEYKDIDEDKIKEATSEIKSLTANLKSAIEDLVYSPEYKAKESLNETIKDAKKIDSDDWNENEEISFTAFQTMISDAEKLVNSSTATVSQLKEAESELNTYIEKYL